jgi:hypothetical protein
MQAVWIGLAVALVAIVATLLWRRNSGDVIDAPRHGPPPRPTARPPAPTATKAAPTPSTDESDMTAGELLRAEGGDAYLQALATWIEDRALEDLGGDVAQPEPTRRVVDAARQALADLRAQGRATVTLPALVAGAAGPGDFHRVLEFAAIDRALVEDFELGVGALLRGHDEDTRVVALGTYLMSEARAMSGRELDGRVETVPRMADAARAAWAAFFQSGRAEVALPGFGAEPGFNFRYTVDQQVMKKALAALDAIEKSDAASAARTS